MSKRKSKGQQQQKQKEKEKEAPAVAAPAPQAAVPEPAPTPAAHAAAAPPSSQPPPTAAGLETCVHTLYDYVHCSTITKEDKKRIKAEMVRLFGEAAAQALLTLLEAQRKEVTLRVKDMRAEELPSVQPMDKYVESVQLWWDSSIKPFFASTLAKQTKPRGSPVAQAPAPFNVPDGMEGTGQPGRVSGSVTPALLGPYPEPTLCSLASSGLHEDAPTNVLDEFYLKLSHVSSDTLTKVLESTRVKASFGNLSRKEMQDALMERMVRCGAERFTTFMEKGNVLDVFDTTRAALVEMLCNRLVQTVNSIPPASLPRVLGAMCLASSFDTYDIVERILVLGLEEVLRNVKSRVLKKIAQEVTAIAHNTGDIQPTGNDILDIIVQVFPQEQRRVDVSKGPQAGMAVSRIMVEFLASSREGNLGVTMWRLMGVSLMKNCADRLTTPEFEYGGFKWSLLCMQHNGNLAIYLRQMNPVRCVFFVSILNRRNEPDIHREGTTTFHGHKDDSDWGFANVVSFEHLLNPKSNFVIDRSDMITFQVRLGILSGDVMQPPPRTAAPAAATTTTTMTHTAHTSTVQRQQHLQQQQQLQQQQLTQESVRAAEMARRELEREVEEEQRRRQKKELQKMGKAAAAQIKTQETRTRKEIDAEYMHRLAAIKDEVAKEMLRLDKIRKQREKIPKLIHSLQQQNDVLQGKHEEVSAYIRQESEAVAALQEEVATLTQDRRKCEEETVRVKSELDTVVAELNETLELIEELKKTPPRPVRVSAPVPAAAPPQQQQQQQHTAMHSQQSAATAAGAPGAPPGLAHPVMDFVETRQRPTADASLLSSVLTGGGAFGQSAVSGSASTPSGGWKSWSPI
eukprot:PhM_4_TR5925/c0_g3_i1/m.11423